MRRPDYSPGCLLSRPNIAPARGNIRIKTLGFNTSNLCGLEPQLIKLEFIIYLPKLKVSRALLGANRYDFTSIIGPKTLDFRFLLVGALFCLKRPPKCRLYREISTILGGFTAAAQLF